MLLSLKDIVVLAVHFGFSLATTSVIYEYDPTLMTYFVILENESCSKSLIMEIGTYQIVFSRKKSEEVKTRHFYDKAHYRVVDFDE